MALDTTLEGALIGAIAAIGGSALTAWVTWQIQHAASRRTDQAASVLFLAELRQMRREIGVALMVVDSAVGAAQADMRRQDAGAGEGMTAWESFPFAPVPYSLPSLLAKVPPSALVVGAETYARLDKVMRQANVALGILARERESLGAPMVAGLGTSIRNELRTARECCVALEAGLSIQVPMVDEDRDI